MISCTCHGGCAGHGAGTTGGRRERQHRRPAAPSHARYRPLSRPTTSATASIARQAALEAQGLEDTGSAEVALSARSQPSATTSPQSAAAQQPARSPARMPPLRSRTDELRPRPERTATLHKLPTRPPLILNPFPNTRETEGRLSEKPLGKAFPSYFSSGRCRARTSDLLLVRQALSQLS